MESEETETLSLLSDSRAAIGAIHRLIKGGAPESGIQVGLKTQLTRRHSLHVGNAIAWVRGHLGNEKSDRLALLHSYQGSLSGLTLTVTPNGLRARSKRVRMEESQMSSLGSNRSSWNRHTLQAVTWLRTNKGLMWAWLTHIGKAPSAACPCEQALRIGDTSPSPAQRTPEPEANSHKHATPGATWTRTSTSREKRTRNLLRCMSFSAINTIISLLNHPCTLPTLCFFSTYTFSPVILLCSPGGSD